jgi:hypothetical protein
MAKEDYHAIRRELTTDMRDLFANAAFLLEQRIRRIEVDAAAARSTKKKANGGTRKKRKNPR